MWIMHRLQQQTESTFELGNYGLSQGGEVDVFVLIVDVFGQLGDAFCVGLTFKDLTLTLQKCFQFLVVCDNTIVDNSESESRVTPRFK